MSYFEDFLYTGIDERYEDPFSQEYYDDVANLQVGDIITVKVNKEGKPYHLSGFIVKTYDHGRFYMSVINKSDIVDSGIRLSSWTKYGVINSGFFFDIDGDMMFVQKLGSAEHETRLVYNDRHYFIEEYNSEIFIGDKHSEEVYEIYSNEDFCRFTWVLYKSKGAIVLDYGEDAKKLGALIAKTNYLEDIIGNYRRKTHVKIN